MLARSSSRLVCSSRARNRLAISSSLAIIATLGALSAPQARAQSFLGTPTVQFETNPGDKAIVTTGPGTTTVTVNAGQAVIDWTADDTVIGGGAIIWQDVGTTATFNSALADYAVLNRIVPTDPTRQIQFNGTVTSTVAGGGTGGSVYFYSPGGIIAGDTALFDVGSLALTSAAPLVDGTGRFIDDAGLVSFQTANAGSRVDVASNAELRASGYVALVSPSVSHDGTITLTGSGTATAALVAANAADITFSPDGLFDISIPAGGGTAATGTVLRTAGTIERNGGPTATGAFRSYLVAVPQNQAITMLVDGASLGFDFATGASVVDNTVVLSGGYNVVAGQAEPTARGTTGAVDVRFRHSDAASLLAITSNDTAIVLADGFFTTMSSDLRLSALRKATLSSIAEGLVSISGNAEISAIDPGLFANAGQNVSAGTVEFIADGFGRINVGGDLTALANATSADVASGVSGSATGGSILLNATFEGAVQSGGAILFAARGVSGRALGNNTGAGAARGGLIDVRVDGQFSTFSDVNGILMQFDASASVGDAIGSGSIGTATGGTVNLVASNLGTISASELRVDATARGGELFRNDDDSGPVRDKAGFAQGGNVLVNATQEGMVLAEGPVDIAAFAIGGRNSAQTAGGDARGGVAELVVDTFGEFSANDLTIDAGGRGGGTTSLISAGGNGTGGRAAMRIADGLVDLLSGVSITADGGGGSGAFGGTGLGGEAILEFLGGTLNTGTEIYVNANGAGGGFGDTPFSDGGTGRGGTARVTIAGGGVSLPGLVVTAHGFGADGWQTGNGGAGFGGTARLEVLNGASFELASNLANIDAQGWGGDAGFEGGLGGFATGGNASVTIHQAQFVLGSGLSVNADAVGGASNPGGIIADVAGGGATAGRAQIDVTGEGLLSVSGTLQASATATGGFGIVGGTATGGRAQVFAGGGTVSAGDVEVRALGNGGMGDPQLGFGGRGQGGFASLTLSTAAGLPVDFSVGNRLLVDASGIGASSGSGGAGTGGTARIESQGGDLAATNLEVRANGVGGDGAGPDGAVRGGNGQGGLAELLAGTTARPAGGSTIGADSMLVTALGRGGGGFIGGNGAGGTVNVTAGWGALFAQSLTASAIGQGGQGNANFFGDAGAQAGHGGSGAGGTVFVNAQSSTGGASLIDLGSLDALANGVGGNGGDGLGNGAGGDGGAASGGFVTVTGSAGNGGLQISSLTAQATALGGNGGAGVGLLRAGGQGGSATGGLVQAGLESGAVTATNSGFAAITAPLIEAWAIGGNGGAGGSDPGGAGANGNGGNATGGTARLLAHGGLVSTVETLRLFADATGGAGGSGTAPQGNGGSAISGSAGINVTRGQLSAGAVDGSAAAIAGAGTVTGQALAGAQPLTIDMADGSIQLTNLSFIAGGTGQVAGTAPSRIAIRNGSVTASGGFSFRTPGTFTLDLDGATLQATDLELAAANWVLGSRPVSAGRVSATSTLLQTGGDLATYAGFDFVGDRVIAGNVVRLGDVTASGSLQVTAAQSIDLGSASAQAIWLMAGQSITTGLLNSATDLALLAGQSVATGTLLAGASFDTTGNLLGATGRVLIGNSAMLSAGGTAVMPGGSIDALLAAAPLPVAGTVTLNGTVAAGSLLSTSLGSLTAGKIVASTGISIDSGGLVTAAESWSAPVIDIRSADIELLGRLNAGVSGMITLTATGAGPALIGDGLTGGGYRLGKGEFSLINSGSLYIAAVDRQDQVIDMLIGDLAMTGPLAGSTIDDPFGSVVFSAGDFVAGAPGGGIRVSGNLTGQGFLDTNSLEFRGSIFQLDNRIGSVRLNGAGTELAGTIRVSATHVHMADTLVLAKLEADPFYQGRIFDLNRPSVVPHRNGVFAAAGMEFFALSSLYIQNTGSSLIPAGFLVNEGGLRIFATPNSAGGTGALAMIVNGAFLNSTGTVTGRAALDLYLAGKPDLSIFAAQSQLNACTFDGACQPVSDPVSNVSSEIIMATQPGLSDSPAVENPSDGESSADGRDEDEAAAEEEAARSPIDPPAPPVDTRPLNPPVSVTEPVAGSGNPALIGTVVDEDMPAGDTK